MKNIYEFIKIKFPQNTLQLYMDHYSHQNKKS